MAALPASLPAAAARLPAAACWSLLRPLPCPVADKQNRLALALAGGAHHLPGSRGILCARRLGARGPHRPHLHAPGQPRGGRAAAGKPRRSGAAGGGACATRRCTGLRSSAGCLPVPTLPPVCAPSNRVWCHPASLTHIFCFFAEHLHDRSVSGGRHAGPQHRAVRAAAAAGGVVGAANQQRSCAARWEPEGAGQGLRKTAPPSSSRRLAASFHSCLYRSPPPAARSASSTSFRCS